MSTCALKKYAHMATTRSGGCEQRPELYATFLRAGALATRHTHIKHTNLPVLVTHICKVSHYRLEQGDAQKLLRS